MKTNFPDDRLLPPDCGPLPGDWGSSPTSYFKSCGCGSCLGCSQAHTATCSMRLKECLLSISSSISLSPHSSDEIDELEGSREDTWVLFVWHVTSIPHRPSLSPQTTARLVRAKLSLLILVNKKFLRIHPTEKADFCPWIDSYKELTFFRWRIAHLKIIKKYLFSSTFRQKNVSSDGSSNEGGKERKN